MKKNGIILLVIVLVGVSATLVGVLYHDNAYRNMSLIELANYNVDQPVSFSLRKEKRWAFLPGPDNVDIALTHSEYVTLLLQSECEQSPQYRFDGNGIVQVYVFKH